MQRATPIAALAGITTMVALIFLRGFFWHHALLVGVAVTALVLAARNALARIGRLRGR